MKRLLDKLGFTLAVFAFAFIFVSAAEARPHLPRKAAKGAAHVAKKLAHIIRCN